MTTPRRSAPLLVTLVGLAALALPARAADVPGFSGYTRPGNPGDTVTGDRVVPAALTDETRPAAVGGTVYFLVLALDPKGTADDPWGSGVSNLVAAFRGGVDFAGDHSPGLDLKAKYLYLYQTVNDRRTPNPIRSTAVRLQVDPKEITSWGYFRGLGLAVPPGAGTREGEKAVARVRPVSYSNVIAVSDADRAYRVEAPAIFPGRPFRLAPVPTGRDEAAPEKGKGPVAVVWDALDPAVEPDHVMLLTRSDFPDAPSFRAIWGGEGGLKKEMRSTVFGYTSDRPPVLDKARVRGAKAVGGGDIKPAKGVRAGEAEPGVFFVQEGPADPEAGDGAPAATGQVPTAKPESPPTTLEPFPDLAGGGLAAPAPAVVGGGGGGGPAGGGAVAAPLAAPRGPGAAAGGGSSGSGGQGQQQQEAQDQTTTTDSQTDTTTDTVITTEVPVTVNVTQNQEQSQSQKQTQGQKQSQDQDQDGGGDCRCEVIPQPAAWLLAALGLPALFLVRRRHRKT